MGRYVTVSAKIPRELKEWMRKCGIKPGPIIRKALEDAVRRKVLEEIDERLERFSELLDRIPDEEIARLIREDRDSR
ncbi:MAG: hypothetical protein ACP5JF_06515 [Candidatus Methanodesulfokora sp.]|jgi:hypothetical protein